MADEFNSDEFNSDGFDLSGADIKTSSNNVRVATDRPILEANEEVSAEKAKQQLLFSLLGGKRAAVKPQTQQENSQEILFKLLSLNEFEEAIVNISYSCDLSQYVPESARSSFKILGLEEVGLSFNLSKFAIEGTPNQLGVFQIAIQFTLRGAPFSKMVSLRVKTLWKEIDPDDNIPFPKANYDSRSVIVDEYKRLGLKNMVAASKRGRSHAFDGKPRDDDFAIQYDQESGWYLAAVCDGAGSAPLSREGSRIVCNRLVKDFLPKISSSDIHETIVKLKNQYFADGNCDVFESSCAELFVNPLRDFISGVLKEFNEVANHLDDAMASEFATTLLLCVFRRLGDDWIVFSYNVGDGAIALVDSIRSQAAVLCNPDEGQYFGETRFITTRGIAEKANIKKRICARLVSDFDMMFLMTDGVSDPKFETDKNLHDARKWISFSDDLKRHVMLYGSNDAIEQQMLSYLDFWSIGNHDDRTLVVVY